MRFSSFFGRRTAMLVGGFGIIASFHIIPTLLPPASRSEPSNDIGSSVLNGPFDEGVSKSDGRSTKLNSVKKIHAIGYTIYHGHIDENIGCDLPIRNVTGCKRTEYIPDWKDSFLQPFSEVDVDIGGERYCKQGFCQHSGEFYMSPSSCGYGERCTDKVALFYYDSRLLAISHPYIDDITIKSTYYDGDVLSLMSEESKKQFFGMFRKI